MGKGALGFGGKGSQLGAGFTIFSRCHTLMDITGTVKAAVVLGKLSAGQAGVIIPPQDLRFIPINPDKNLPWLSVSWMVVESSP